MASSLILHKRIVTTLAKAKELRKYVEPLITRSKEDTMHSRRVVFSYLQDKYSTQELFDRISEKVADRPGGYTRIIKLPNRLGDNAEQAMIELVDYNTDLLEAKEERKSSGRRRRGKSKKSTSEPVAATEEVVEEVAEVSEARAGEAEADEAADNQEEKKAE
jgi:large subunit ribosomal protein L17